MSYKFTEVPRTSVTSIAYFSAITVKILIIGAWDFVGPNYSVPILDMIAVKIAPNTRNHSSTPTATNISDALAKFAFVGFVVDPNPQTKSITNPTIGIAVINNVITHSPIDMIGDWS